jgi:DNA-binding NarL/FixJ family response regulator
MIQHLELASPLSSDRFDIVVFSNRAIFSYAFRKLIEESTNLKVILLPTYVVYCSRISQGFSGLLVLSIEKADLLESKVLQHIREALPLARVLLILPASTEFCEDDLQTYAHSIWSENSTISELLEATIITLKGGAWIEKQVSAYSRTDFERNLPQQHNVLEANSTPSSILWKRLTDREIQILKLMAIGYSNQQIAESLFISVSTVKNHSARLFAKLGTKNRTGAVLKAIEMGVISHDKDQDF